MQGRVREVSVNKNLQNFIFRKKRWEMNYQRRRHLHINLLVTK
jgi:hypothetical protein